MARPRPPWTGAAALLLAVLAVAFVTGQEDEPTAAARGAAATGSGGSSQTSGYGSSGGDTSVILGVAQYEEEYWDLSKSVEKACKFIRAAGAANIKLLMFPEAAISGYPWWNFWTHTFDLRANEAMQELFVLNSPRIGYPEFQPLLDCIKEAKVNVVMAINERDNEGSQAAVFNTAVFIDLNGRIVGRHRKILPSFTERFWWTFGDGSDLIVVDLPGVGRTCALLCWENFVALARYTLLAQGCEFWVAPTQDIGPWWTAHLKHIARETRSYVLAMGQILRPAVAKQSELAAVGTKEGSAWVSSMLADWAKMPFASTGYFMDGGGTIVGPDGESLAGPVYSGCSFCEPACNGTRKYSVAWAQQGCPGLDGGSACSVVEVPGVTDVRNGEEFVLAARVPRKAAAARQPASENTGYNSPSGIWRFTWFNRPGNYIKSTNKASAVSGDVRAYVSRPGVEDRPINAPGSVGNGLGEA